MSLNLLDLLLVLSPCVDQDLILPFVNLNGVRFLLFAADEPIIPALGGKVPDFLILYLEDVLELGDFLFEDGIELLIGLFEEGELAVVLIFKFFFLCLQLKMVG